MAVSEKPPPMMFTAPQVGHEWSFHRGGLLVDDAMLAQAANSAFLLLLSSAQGGRNRHLVPKCHEFAVHRRRVELCLVRQLRRNCAARYLHGKCVSGLVGSENPPNPIWRFCKPRMAVNKMRTCRRRSSRKAANGWATILELRNGLGLRSVAGNAFRASASLQPMCIR